jgi:hypothetical protein
VSTPETPNCLCGTCEECRNRRIDAQRAAMWAEHGIDDASIAAERVQPPSLSELEDLTKRVLAATGHDVTLDLQRELALAHARFDAAHGMEAPALRSSLAENERLRERIAALQAQLAPPEGYLSEEVDVGNKPGEQVVILERDFAGRWSWRAAGRCGGARTRDEALYFAGWWVGRRALVAVVRAQVDGIDQTEET